MAIELLAKIKPKNNSDFMLVDSVDVEMSDGRNLQETLEDFSAGTIITLNGEETDEYQFVIDLNEEPLPLPGQENAFMTQIQQMFAGLQEIIDKQNEKILELEKRIAELELYIETKGEEEEEETDSILDYDGCAIVDYDGTLLGDYEEENPNEGVVAGSIVDFKGNVLKDYKGYILGKYNK